MLTPDLLRRVMPGCPAPDLYAEPCWAAMVEADITTVVRAAAFLAQISWESNDLQHWEELASGRAYEGRLDLGNTEPGDGPRFKGRGPLQVTGRKAYLLLEERLGVPVLTRPELVAQPETGFRAAGVFWSELGALRLSKAAQRHLGTLRGSLNQVADKPDFYGVTMAINGLASLDAPSHHRERVKRYQRALELLAVVGRL